MLYDITLRQTHSFAGTAKGGRHLARLMPADLPGRQRLIAGHLDIVPTPDERMDRPDFFGNLTTDFAYRGALGRVALRLQARVERAAGDPARGPSLHLADLPAALALRDLGASSPLHCLAASPRVPRDEAIAAYAAALIDPAATVQDAVTALGRAIHADMRYDPDATEVDTPVAEAFAARHGVCQDFSHLMIAGLRAQGIPAGYVSGFLSTRPPPGRARLEGADAMHAWVRAWCGPDAGWIEYDPTNDCEAGEAHVTVAHGRDYTDVSPVRGVLRVSGRQSSAQTVDMVPLPG